MMTQTTKCIRCGKQAKMWTGWCSRCCIKVWRACHGWFRREYGEGKC